MKREWQPGDVAMVTFYAEGFPVTAVGVRAFYEKVGTNVWWTPRGWVGDYSAKFVRPLVVIEPALITGPDETGEDGDPLVDIANCLRRLAEGDHPTTYRRRVAERLAEVFAPTPIKPDEPLGLGAVVEDADGERYVRHGSSDLDESVTWCNSAGVGRSWARIAAVRVLSEGVTP